MLCDLNWRTREFAYFRFTYLIFFLQGWRGQCDWDVDTASSQEGFLQCVPLAEWLGKAVLLRAVLMLHRPLWHSCAVTFWSVLIAYEFQNWQNLQKNEDNPSSLAACQELAILHNLQLQMLFSDIYMQILEQNENEKQRVNGNAAIYMYKRKTTGKF